MNVITAITTTTTLPPVDPTLRILGGISYVVLAGCSFSAYAILAVILGRINKRSAFFLITWQLVACDMVTQLVQLVVAVPNTLTGELVGGFWAAKSNRGFSSIAMMSFMLYLSSTLWRTMERCRSPSL